MSKRNEYAFTTHWRVPSTCQEISEILGNGPDLARWWPSVYLDVQEVEPGDSNGVGKVVSLHTKGWLPYTLRWHSFIMKPIFSANHHWAMRQGEESLKRELIRRQGETAVAS